MDLTIPIRVEKIETGYRAVSGEPVPLAIEAPTRAEAIAQLRSQAQREVENGLEFITIQVPHFAKRQAPILPDDEITREWIEIMAENRRLANEAEAEA